MNSNRAVPLILTILVALSGLPVNADPVDFSLNDLDGKTIKLSDYRGRWVIVNFWATWCPPCIRELPELIAFQAANPEHMVLGINFEKIEASKIKAFATSFAINYPVLTIGDKPLVPFEPLLGLPTTAVVSPDGNILAKHEGPVTRVMLEEFLSRQTRGAEEPVDR